MKSPQHAQKLNNGKEIRERNKSHMLKEWEEETRKPQRFPLRLLQLRKIIT